VPATLAQPGVRSLPTAQMAESSRHTSGDHSPGVLMAEARPPRLTSVLDTFAEIHRRE